MFISVNNSKLIRLVYSLALVAAFFLLPWWWTFVWALLGLLFFPNYFEAVLVGLAYDSIFAAQPLPKLSIVLAGGLLLVSLARTLLRYYA